MSSQVLSIEWQVLRAGQPRPYADSIYEYVIKSKLPESFIKNFCTKVLKPCDIPSKAGNEQFTGSCGFPYGLDSFYKFKQEAEGIYKYVVCEPFTD